MSHHAVPKILLPATISRCVPRLFRSAVALVAATLLPGVACAAAINVSINTSMLSGSSANLAFDLTDGDSVLNNSGTLTHFLTDGTVGTPILTGGVNGTLPAQVTIADSSFFNELLIPVVLGGSITFTIDFTNNLGGSVPDNLSFFLLDATATNSLVATNLLGDALLSMDLTGNSGGQVVVGSSINPRVGVSAAPASAGTVPEPSSFLLLGCALAVITYGTRYTRRLTRKGSPILVIAVLVLAGFGPYSYGQSLQLTYSGLVLNRHTQTFDTQATITNVSSSVVTGPFSMVTTIATSGVTLANASCYTDDRKPVLRASFPNGGLISGASMLVLLQFGDGPRQGFNFVQTILLGNACAANVPAITEAFGAASIPLSGTTTLTFNIRNPNMGGVLTGVAFPDTLPSGMVVAATPNLSNTCGGTVTALAGTSTVSLSGGTLGAGASCAVSLNVQGTTVGVKNNSVQASSTEGGGGNTSSASITVVAATATVLLLHSFDNNVPPHGEPLTPHWPGIIAQGTDGVLYTTSPFNGAGASGAVFGVAPSGAFAVVYPFAGSDGSFPYSGVTLGTDGYLYGATGNGGTPVGGNPGASVGTVFKTTPGGNLTVLHNFRVSETNGTNPYAPPVEGPDGNYYGATGQGAAGAGSTIYRITPSGSLQTIYYFGPTLGGVIAPMVLATDGSFYGIGNNSNDSGYGSVFRVSRTGNLTWIYAFDKIHGAYSYAPLIQASDGDFYGTTSAGGDHDSGVVFRLTPAGQITVLHSFNGADGMTPYAGVVQGNDGNFYGATYAGGTLGGGTLYRVTSQGAFTVLHNFDSPTSPGPTGANPMVTLTQHTNGLFYGDTAFGGAYRFGAFYSLDVGLPPFIRLVSSVGTVGTSIGILGQGFTGAKNVSFNGVAASFTVVSDTYLTAVVPTGSAPGPVVVTTLNGSLTSNTSFQARTKVSVRDFRGIGRSDALLYNPSNGQSYTALTNGDGTYQYVPNLFSTVFDTLRTGDFNGDGKSDLIVYSAATALAYIGFSNGDGTFNFQSLFFSPGYNFVEAGDLNGDGKADVLLYNSATGVMYTAISNGSGQFTYAYHPVSVGFTTVRLADFTGDGKADVFLYNATNGLAFLGISDGNGGFTFKPVSISAGYNLVDVGDLNGDGMADIILYNSATGYVLTGISDGLGGFTFQTQAFSPGFTSVTLADYTGDGKADLTVYNKNTAAAYFGIGQGNGSFSFVYLFWSPGYDVVVAQDVNGDGKADVILYNSATGTEYTGISNGNGTFSYTYQSWGTGKVLAK